MKKWVRRIIVTAVLLVASVSIILFGYNKLYNDKQPEGDIIVKENVKVITSETDNIPIDVREDYLVFGEKPEYKKGDVIVSGITENSLEGYIRRIYSHIVPDEWNDKGVYLKILKIFDEHFETVKFIIDNNNSRVTIMKTREGFIKPEKEEYHDEILDKEMREVE